jgi:hypothetical protein
MSAPPVKVRGGRQRLAEPPPKKKTVKSNFLLTINTGQRYAKDDPHRDSDAQIFEESLHEMCRDLGSYVKVLEGSWDKDHIESVECDVAVEFGPKTQALHAHILFKIKHSTRVLLDYDKIKAKLKKDLGLPSFYLYNRLVKASSSDFLADYLSKSYNR